MKKLARAKKYLPVALALAAFATVGTTSAFAQAYSGVYGSGNVVRNITAENPDGIFRYPFSTESGLSAFAQAPATIHHGAAHHRATHRPMKVAPSPR